MGTDARSVTPACPCRETVAVWCWVPAGLSHTGEGRWKECKIDRCVADLVEALQDAHIWTSGSCCGHGVEDGNILLEDGRVLTVTWPTSKRCDEGDDGGEETSG